MMVYSEIVDSDITSNEGKVLLAQLQGLFGANIKSYPHASSKFGSINNNSGGALPFTHNHYLPFTLKVYGNLPYFFKCLLETPGSREIIVALIEEQRNMASKHIEKELERAKRNGQIEAVNDIQKRFTIVGVNLQEGLNNTQLMLIIFRL